MPEKFAPLEHLLQEMPLIKPDGSAGLLAKGLFGAKSADIPDYTKEIESISDHQLLAALFRDYTFWASAYLLEPCNLRFMEKNDTADYGLGREVLPLNIASPLSLVAKKLGAKPFMEYAQSYALYNWKKTDRSGPLQFDNLQVIRTFSGLPSEAAFILVHVTMVSRTPKLVAAANDVLKAAEHKDRNALNAAMKSYCDIMRSINAEMETMWGRSLPEDYQHFRIFIMGTKDQPMFPNGVWYEARDPKNSDKVIREGPFQYRGESGANDSIIPTTDNLLELTDSMPSNQLTEILKDFRSYRPLAHNTFVKTVYEQAKKAGVKAFSLQDAVTATHYLSILDQVRDFRFRHWNFTKEYIIKRSAHPVATGGSPIVEWLPNQLGAVLNAMQDVAGQIHDDQVPQSMREELTAIRSRITSQSNQLAREVEKLRAERSTGCKQESSGSGKCPSSSNKRGGCPI